MKIPIQQNGHVIHSMKVKRIALLLETGMAFDRAIARGIGKYIRGHRGWIILMDPMMEVTSE